MNTIDKEIQTLEKLIRKKDLEIKTFDDGAHKSFVEKLNNTKDIYEKRLKELIAKRERG